MRARTFSPWLSTIGILTFVFHYVVTLLAAKAQDYNKQAKKRDRREERKIIARIENNNDSDLCWMAVVFVLSTDIQIVYLTSIAPNNNNSWI